MTRSFLEVNCCDGIVEVILNRPEKRNSLTFELISELTSTLKEIEKSDALGVVLGSAGSVFCAGHDYNDMLSRDLAGMRQLMHSCSQLMQLIHRVPQPVIARVQGVAVGAGCQLALSCDMVVASETAVFRTPGGAGGWFCFTPMVALARSLGQKRALEMLMIGEPVMASQAFNWGMINRVVPKENLEAETKALAVKATQGSRLMKGLGKHAYYTQIELDEAKAYEYAAELMASSGMMHDPQERMKAFMEKRAPRLG